MSQIVVIGFDSEGDAFAALKTLRRIEREGGIKFEDTAVVSHRADGTMAVKNEASSTTEVGAVVGGALGGLVFFMFPVAGIALGAAAGAGIGAMVGNGVDGKFRDEVKAKLPPGRSALFLVIREANAEMAIPALRRYHGEVIQTTLSEETEEALRDALKS
jgi:uncharacterized membrane protein